MIEADTIKLLRECDAGIKMGVKSIDDVLEYVKSEGLRKCLAECKREHEVLKQEVQRAFPLPVSYGKDVDAAVGAAVVMLQRSLNQQKS